MAFRLLSSWDPKEYLLSKVEMVDGHWLWKNRFTEGSREIGYGIAYIGLDANKKRMYELAHIRSYRLFIGPIPAGLYILHDPKCPYRRCINPDHLRAGTPQDNVDDVFLHSNNLRRCRSKLQDWQVFHIWFSNKTTKELAELYSLAIVKDIRGARTWRWLTQSLQAGRSQ